MSKFTKLIEKWMAGRDEYEAAKELGVVPNTIVYWLHGVHFPPESKLPVYAAAFGVSENALRAAIAEAKDAARMVRK